MIIFKKDEKIAFKGIYVEEFKAGIGYDLSAEKISELTELNIDFVITEGEILDLTEEEKAEAIEVAEVIQEVIQENEVAAKTEVTKKKK